MDTIQSWLGTADMAGQAWLNHTTPEKYTRQTLELANQTLRQTAEQLLKSPPAGIDTAGLDSLLTSGGDRIAQMARYVQSRNAPDLAKQLDSLRADARIIKTLGDRIKASE